MNILGVHIGHDSSAALLQDGHVIADVAEERFVRIKHYSGLPFESIKFCLAHAGIDPRKLDVVAFSQSVPPRGADVLFPDLDLRRKDLRGKVKEAVLEKVGGDMRRNGLPVYMAPFKTGQSVEVELVEHHEAHAASAYYTCGRPLSERVTVVTLDGVGQGVSCAIWRGEQGRLEPLWKTGTDGSLGFFYSNVTEALGWWHGDGEGKTMGLAPYGDPSAATGVFDGHYPRFEDGALIEPYDFGSLRSIEIAGARHHHLPDAATFAARLSRYRPEDLAAESQTILEREVMNLVLPWMRREGTMSLACAGGVFLNVKLNQRIWCSGQVTHHHIYPNAGDSGLAVGAALAAFHKRNPTAPLMPIDNLYKGPEYSEEEIEALLKSREIPFRRPDNLVSAVAGSLAQNKIIGWFQGRMESGPRALGNRSILMSANDPRNKDTLNARVKFREAFRPFCPSLLAESRDSYFKRPRNEEFMITSFDVTDQKKDRIPAVVHVDGTLRPQLIRSETNSLYYELIKEFGRLTGETLLLNTSFNIKGEPIIRHPQEAIRCFYDSGLDTLVLGPFVVTKNGSGSR
jgi:carbamoyltransferase